jgi:hypothetical protein
MRQPHILIIVQNLPFPFDRRAWQEATSLQHAGFAVSVICPKKKICTKGYEKLEGVDIHRYPLIYEANEGGMGYFVEFLYCWLAALILSVRVFAIQACNLPDTNLALGMLFRLFGARFVFDHHDLFPEMCVAKARPRSGLLYCGLILLERRTLRFTDRIIAVNQSRQEIAINRGGVSALKVCIVRSVSRRTWAEMKCYTPELKRGRKCLAMYLGEMCEQDGTDYRVRAIARYKELPGAADDTLLAFVGGGLDQPRMKQMAIEMGWRR